MMTLINTVRTEHSVGNNCPECGSSDLYGPVSDYWGICCPECGWEGDIEYHHSSEECEVITQLTDKPCPS